jgi:hypothetical protein
VALVRQQPVPDPRLYPDLVEELRAALRDALRELPDDPGNPSLARGMDRSRMIERHAANGRGRDFIVGDLHGCRAMLDALLVHVGFDPDRDRLFSVGDLMDRIRGLA